MIVILVWLNREIRVITNEVVNVRVKVMRWISSDVVNTLLIVHEYIALYQRKGGKQELLQNSADTELLLQS